MIKQEIQNILKMGRFELVQFKKLDDGNHLILAAKNDSYMTTYYYHEYKQLGLYESRVFDTLEDAMSDYEKCTSSYNRMVSLFGGDSNEQ